MMIEDLVTLKRSKRARRVALRLDPVQRIIHLVVPEKMSDKRAYHFAAAHEHWVRETLGNLASPIPFEHGAILPIFGDEVRLEYVHDTSLKRTTVAQGDDVLTVKTYMDDLSNRVRAHLKKLARAGLADMAQDKAQAIDKALHSVSVRDTKSRWGSCSQAGDISFSWRLIFAPYVAIDYVVAHEVAHLVHMNHSREFWAVCEGLCVDYRGGKAWMKAHGNTLMRYGADV